MDDLKFGGREFVLITASTVQRDIVLGQLLDSAGVKEAIAENIADDQSMNMAIAAALMRGDRLFDLIGCSLVPVGTDPLKWTPELGHETAQFFAVLPGESNTKRVLAAGIAFVRAFFMVELLSMTVSRKYSPVPMETGQLDGGSAATSISATGG
jgi:hypothetical protein